MYKRNLSREFFKLSHDVKLISFKFTSRQSRAHNIQPIFINLLVVMVTIELLPCCDFVSLYHIQLMLVLLISAFYACCFLHCRPIWILDIIINLITFAFRCWAFSLSLHLSRRCSVVGQSKSIRWTIANRPLGASSERTNRQKSIVEQQQWTSHRSACFDCRIYPFLAYTWVSCDAAMKSETQFTTKLASQRESESMKHYNARRWDNNDLSHINFISSNIMYHDAMMLKGAAKCETENLRPEWAQARRRLDSGDIRQIFDVVDSD